MGRVLVRWTCLWPKCRPGTAPRPLYLLTRRATEPRFCNGQVASSPTSPWHVPGLPTCDAAGGSPRQSPPTGCAARRWVVLVSRQEMLSGQITWNGQEIFQRTRFRRGSGYAYLSSRGHRRARIAEQRGSQPSAPGSGAQLTPARQVPCCPARLWAGTGSSVGLIPGRTCRVVGSTMSFFLSCAFVEDLTVGRGED